MAVEVAYRREDTAAAAAPQPANMNRFWMVALGAAVLAGALVASALTPLLA